jgi:nucleotide-binding universal stress UspA family protein
MFSNIVVGTDGSDTAQAAVSLAGRLAQEGAGVVHLVNAYGSSTAAVSMALAAGAVGTAVVETMTNAPSISADVLARAAASLEEAGVRVERHAVDGSPADAIISVAEAAGADLIVVGSRGMQGARRVLGSTPNSVAHKAPCHVLVAKTC